MPARISRKAVPVEKAESRQNSLEVEKERESQNRCVVDREASCEAKESEKRGRQLREAAYNVLICGRKAARGERKRLNKKKRESKDLPRVVSVIL